MKTNKLYLLIIVLMELFALIAQLVLLLQAARTPLAEALTRYFSYFTILTNIIVGVYAGVHCFTPPAKRTGFFFRPSVETAITLYITIVGLTYTLVLRQLWSPKGLQAVVDDILHTIVPVMILFYWWKWVETRRLKYGNIPFWLIYPAVYALLILIRGHFGSWYPYPFLDVLQYLYGQVVINCIFMLLAFVLFSSLFVWAGKRKPR
ncbi:Pr6Pr family membrane protein [Flavitalea sp. BT771]|uniref:Pr6Pr family membrane protein n=1 Tax=Flavitalea sp. BT771 TaxID=3063329 RepID=UPI0026E262B7|nr:Pr6Pr family membrane protein [Flavitalea sp. BT771]MDO6433170.1 Pr6Pr family membrane protein [Flavitalea sp. BT771]MDV6221554.1 Pr6Pr family membrane protein [Flavitalea sp. BT771]